MRQPMLKLVLDGLEREVGRLPTVAAEAGISVHTVRALHEGRISDPRVSIVQSLYDTLYPVSVDA